MWAKITHALKSRTEADSANSHNNVMSRIYEQHPNLSVFHVDEVPHLAPSPPSSPSKHSRRGMFKRTSKSTKNGDDEPVRAASPMLQIGLPKKLKSNFNSSQISLSRASTDAHRPSEDPRPSQGSSSGILRRASHDILRQPPQDMLQVTELAPPKSVSNHGHESASLAVHDLSRPSLDSSRALLAPLDNCSSVRSILRDPKTPGTGQNVRFFSRDAYKVISPDASLVTDDSKNPDIPLLEKLQQASNTPPTKTATRPSIAEVFASVDPPKDSKSPDDESLGSTLQSAPPSDISNFFNMSKDRDLPPIPVGFDVQLFDEPVEINEPDRGTDGINTATGSPATNMTSTPINAKSKHLPSPPPEQTPPLNRSPSFSFGQTLFHSMSGSSPTGSDHSKASSLPTDLRKYHNSRPSTAPVNETFEKTRNRALSDTVFQTMIRGKGKSLPEADINDEATSHLVVYSAEPDPFNAHATTYYTPQTMMPVTPPREGGRHAKKTSREEDLIVTLRTQLALQSELCTQYEIDLRARDELVDHLQKRVEAAEREGEKRRNTLKIWKKRVTDLERTCRHLEEEVDQSRQESMERSIMDEASSEALRMLHTQIAALERDKQEADKREEALREEVGTLEALVKEKTDGIQKLNETLWTRDEREQELEDGIRDAKAQMEKMDRGGIVGEDVKVLIAKAELANEEEKERHRLIEASWHQERTELDVKLSQLRREKCELEDELNDASATLKSRGEELAALKEELEAQWKHTESASAKTEQLGKENHNLQQERDALGMEVKSLEERITGLELEWTECENRRAELDGQVQELWNARDVIEKEKDELNQQLRLEREQVNTLTRVLQEREDRIVGSEQERQFALENVTRLEEKVRQRDAELAASAQRIMQKETDTEQIREEMSDMKRQHARVVDEHIRALQEMSGQESEARKHLEALIKDKANADVVTETLKENATALQEEVDRLRRQVQALHQESADKEVKIVQITKQRAQDQEDLNGMNIALDSKQQELELMKRRMGVRGTAGSTPAQPSKIAHRRETSTPASRPLSIVSDSGVIIDKSFETSASVNKVSTLGRSVRANVAALQGSAGSMGPPAPVKPRVSAVNTPTPLPRTFSRSSSNRPSQPQPPPPLHQRSASSTMDRQTRIKRPGVTSPTSAQTVFQDKENVEETRNDVKKRIPVPIPA